MDFFSDYRRRDIFYTRLFCIIMVGIGIWNLIEAAKTIEIFRSDRYLDDNHVYCLMENQNEGRDDTNKKVNILLEGRYACEIGNGFALYNQKGKPDSLLVEFLEMQSHSSNEFIDFLTKIPSNNKEGFIVIAVEIEKPTDKEIEKVNNLINSYYSNSKVENKNVLSGSGELIKISKTEQDLINAAISKFGLKEIENSKIEYKLKYKDKTFNSERSGKIYIAISLVLFMMAITFWLTRTNRNDRNSIWQNFYEKDVDVDDVYEDIQYGKKYKKIIIGKKYAMAYSNGTKFIDGKTLAWVYPKVDVYKHRTCFFITVSKTYSYMIGYWTFSGENEELHVTRKKKEFEEIMEDFLTIAPGVLYGENKEWKKLIRNNREEFLRMARLSRLKEENQMYMDEYMDQFESRFDENHFYK